MKTRNKLLKIFGIFLFYFLVFSNSLKAQVGIDYPIALNSFTGIISGRIYKSAPFVHFNKCYNRSSLVLGLSSSLFKNKENSFVTNVNFDLGIKRKIYFGNGNGILIPYFNLSFAKFYYQKKSNTGLKTEIGFSKTFSQRIGFHSAYNRYFTNDFKFDNSTVKGNFGAILIGCEFYIY